MIIINSLHDITIFINFYYYSNVDITIKPSTTPTVATPADTTIKPSTTPTITPPGKLVLQINSCCLYVYFRVMSSTISIILDVVNCYYHLYVPIKDAIVMNTVTYGMIVVAI